jgi:hypothetical protein
MLDHSESIVEAYSKMFPEAEAKISELKRLIALRTKGAPMTEDLDVERSVDDKPYQEAVAHAFLLKKAYRAAAKISHPDKGGNHEEFAAVAAAYKARDLNSLNEFVLYKNRSLLESISYWLDEIEKPKVQWITFQSGHAFKVVQLHKTGHEDSAKDYMQKLLQMNILQLLHESTN